MECVEATRALKSSFLSQMAMKSDFEVCCNDDVSCFTRIYSVGAASDDFPVEDLLNLDFSDKDANFVDDDEVKPDEVFKFSSPSFSGAAEEFDSLSAGEFSVPVEDMENLEWLSQFVDEPSSETSLLCVAGGVFKAESGETTSPDINERPEQLPCFTFKVPSKARSKRMRSNGGRRWSLSSPAVMAADSSSTTSSSTYSSPYVFLNLELFSSVEKPPPLKKEKRKAEAGTGFISGRRCTHCQVQKTPQWRTGPLGPKTLCNACGVRFKSGRLFPEYRPACSPTFSLEMHSNSHRKVLEMRLKKEEEPGSKRAVESES